LKTLTFVAASLLALPLAAQTAPAASPAPAEKFVRSALPACPGLSLTADEMPRKLPTGMRSTLFHVKSEGGYCDGDYVVITSQTGNVWVGTPWYLDGAGDPPHKLKEFAWQVLHDNVEIEIGKDLTRDGLVKITMWQTTARGKVPLEGEMDTDGKVFFLGHFRPQAGDYATSRLESFKPLLANAPTKGASSPSITIIEFSDFECPSCRYGSENVTPILEKHGDKVRYIRYDLPLVSMHPWALTAAMAGRAIYRQKPDLFWTYKKLIYDNQEKLSAFLIDDFASGFAKDHDLDMEKYNADVTSEAIRTELLRAVGVAFSNDIRSTPSYMVNGMIVEAGDHGKDLAAYVDAALAKATPAAK
jgi:protein-disulfide isomerase